MVVLPFMGKTMSIQSVVLLSDQLALQRRMDIIANNIANSGTTGFKREGVEFNTLISNGSASRAAAQNISFVYDRATYRDVSPGTTKMTGNSLDMAIQGKGYFQIQTPQGIQYTRNGAFQTDNQGQIVNSQGMPVLSDGGQPIILPEDARDLTISGDGFITAQVGTGSTRSQLGKIGLVKFENDQIVKPVGNGMLTTTQTAEPVTGNVLVQGALEDSNVSPVLEITEMIKVQRAYEMAANMISAENTRLNTAIDKLSATT